MKLFILHNLIIFFVIILLHYIAALSANGTTDSYYLKTTINKQSSLILGDSLAIQGIRPDVINKLLKNSDYELPIYNYSFNALSSPYGKLYYDAIKRITNTKTKKGLFILQINPESISNYDNNLNENLFRENKYSILKVNNSNPNFSYLLKNYEYGWGKIIIDRWKNKDFLLHQNGWFELKKNFTTKEIKERTKKTLLLRSHNKNLYISKKRVEYLKKTISFLKEYGDVFLIQLPINNEIYKLNNKYPRNITISKYNKIIQEISKSHGVKFYNFQNYNQNFIFNDGMHIIRENSISLTEIIIKTLNI